MVAMEQAFKNSIMVGKFPACVLHLELNCQAVDVNVHPTKLEVRFVNERPVFDAVYHAVKTALFQGDTPTVMTFPQEKPRQPVFPAGEQGSQLRFRSESQTPVQKTGLPPTEHSDKAEKPAAPSTAKPKENSFWQSIYGGGEEKPTVRQTVLRDSNPVQRLVSTPPPAKAKPSVPDTVLEPLPQKEPAKPPVPTPEQALPIAVTEEAVVQSRLVGELFQTYCIVERSDDTVLFIDKHAAHERLLYEKLKAENGTSCAQVLLEPVMVTLQKEEYSMVLESKELFAQAGFDLEDFGEGTILVRSAPLLLDGSDIGGAVLEMAGYLCSQKTDLSTEHMDWIYHNIACRAAIKAGNKTSNEELVALAERLQENPDVKYCPHGRPVSIVMRKKDLEKQFGRIQ